MAVRALRLLRRPVSTIEHSSLCERSPTASVPARFRCWPARRALEEHEQLVAAVDIHRVSQLAALGIGRLASEQPLQLPFKTAAMRGNGGVGEIGPAAADLMPSLRWWRPARPQQQLPRQATRPVRPLCTTTQSALPAVDQRGHDPAAGQILTTCINIGKSQRRRSALPPHPRRATFMIVSQYCRCSQPRFGHARATAR
jgi:hypothetical protein